MNILLVFLVVFFFLFFQFSGPGRDVHLMMIDVITVMYLLKLWFLNILSHEATVPA